MANYLSAYADAFGLRELISFGVTVERLEPNRNGGWRIVLDDGCDPHAYRWRLRSDLRRARRRAPGSTPPTPPTPPGPALGPAQAPWSAGSRPALTACWRAWWSASVWSA